METRHKARVGEHLTVVVSGATPINYPDSQFEEPEPVGTYGRYEMDRDYDAEARWCRFYAQSLHANVQKNGG